MPMIRVRLFGNRTHADALIATLHSIDGVDRVEELDDPTQFTRDDSSSSESVEDNRSEMFFIEVEADSSKRADVVRNVIELEARRLDAVAEMVEEF
ncbi:hypothetical protein [Dyella sp.]|uniref:hypothetical protein n=1 Tax=Dyella sp. TaxID=1869338 RepID=UPI002ED2C503